MILGSHPSLYKSYKLASMHKSISNVRFFQIGSGCNEPALNNRHLTSNTVYDSVYDTSNPRLVTGLANWTTTSNGTIDVSSLSLHNFESKSTPYFNPVCQYASSKFYSAASSQVLDSLDSPWISVSSQTTAVNKHTQAQTVCQRREVCSHRYRVKSERANLGLFKN